MKSKTLDIDSAGRGSARLIRPHSAGRHQFTSAARMLIAAMLASASAGYAADRTWNGSVSGQWSNASNWTGGIPNINDRAILPESAANTTIDLGGAARNVGAMTFDGNVPFTLNNGMLNVSDLSLPTAGNLVVEHTINADLALHSASIWSIGEYQAVNIAGALDSDAGLFKFGTGRLTLSGDTGVNANWITVSQGDLVLEGGSAYSDSGVLTVETNGALQINSDETIGGLSGGGSAALGDNQLTLTGTGASYGGSIQGSDVARLIVDGSGTQTLSGSATLGGIRSQMGTLILNDGQYTATESNDYSILVTDGGSLEVRGGAEVDLPDTAMLDSFSGSCRIRNGSMQVSDAGTLVHGSRMDVTGDSATLTVENSGGVEITDSAVSSLFVGSSTISSYVGTLTVQTGGQVHSSFAILALIPGNVGTVSVSDAGSSFVVDRNISLARTSQSAGGTGHIVVSNGATADVGQRILVGTSASSITVDEGFLTIGELVLEYGAAPTIRISDSTAGRALSLGANDFSGELTALIRDYTSGPGGIEKIGGGTLTLAANQLFTGGMDVSDGVVLLKDAARQFASLTGSGDVTVSSGTRLEGTGVIGGRLVVETNATIEPSAENGSGIGTIDCGALEFQPFGSLVIELGGTNSFDKLVVGGDAIIDGALALTYANGFTASVGDTFEIISADTISGNFEDVYGPDGQTWVTFTADGSLYARVCSDASNCLVTCIEELDRYAVGGDVLSSVSNGSIVAVNRGLAGVEILAAPNQTFGSPLSTISGEVNSTTGVKALALEGDLLVIGGGAPRLYDVSDPANPVLLSTISIYFAWDVALSGDLMAVAHDAGLALFDVSDPTTPTFFLSSAQASVDSGNVVFHGDLLYWNRHNLPQGQMTILDVSNPASVAVQGSIATGSFPTAPQFAGDVAFLGSVQGVRAIDVSDPMNPTQIGFLPDNTPGAGDVALDGRFLYHANNVRGVVVYDVSDPSAIVEVEQLSAYNGAYGLTDADGVLYVSRQGGGLTLLNVSDADADGVIGNCDSCFGDNATGDTDGDGVCENLDVCPDSDDSLDADGDGIADGCDICPGFDDNTDLDGDGVPDGCDTCPGFDDNTDSDGDGLADGCDNCPSAINADQADGDPPSPVLSPIAAWHFDEDGGSTTTDVVDGYIGTLNNGAIWNSTGRHGAAIEFPVGGGTVNVPGSTDFNAPDQVSIALWVKPSAFPTNVNRFVTRSSYVFRLQSGKPHFYVRKDNALIGAQANVLIDADAWTHLAAVWDGLGDGVLRIYVNGVEASAYDFQETAAAPIDSSASGLTIGNAAAEPFEGLMDELAIFSKALSAGEIQNLVSKGLGDGVGDACDLCLGDDAAGDTDGDGVCDNLDVCPGFDDNVDTDGDGIPDGCEAPCGDRQLGDTNGSGIVDVEDIASFSAILLAPLSATPDERCAADVNQDGSVDGLDIQGLMEFLLLP